MFTDFSAQKRKTPLRSHSLMRNVMLEHHAKRNTHWPLCVLFICIGIQTPNDICAFRKIGPFLYISTNTNISPDNSIKYHIHIYIHRFLHHKNMFIAQFKQSSSIQREREREKRHTEKWRVILAFCMSRMHIYQIIYLKVLAVIYATKYRIRYFMFGVEFVAHTWRFIRIMCIGAHQPEDRTDEIKIQNSNNNVHTNKRERDFFLFICPPHITNLIFRCSASALCLSYKSKYLTLRTNEDKRNNRTRSETRISNEK